MKISDKTIGYFSFFALILILSFVAVGMWHAHKATIYTATVDFFDLGSLQIEDAVTMRGYEIGSVRKIEWLGDRARVTLQFDRPILLREGVQIRNTNYALMGQRRIEIISPREGAILPENFIHQGIFEPGVAEALRLIEDALSQVEAVRQIILLVANGDNSHPSFQVVLEEAVQKIDSLLLKTESLARSLPARAGTLTNLADSTARAVSAIATQANSALFTVDSFAEVKLLQANEALKSVSEKAKLADDLITDLETSPIGALLQNDSLIQKTNAFVESIQSLIAAFDFENLDIRNEKGEKVQLVTWKNLNIIGETAREKARKRAREENR